MTLEKSPTIEKDRSDELYSQSINKDPVTGFPYEIPEVREKLVGAVEEAVKNGDYVLYVDADIDNLKKLNTIYKHQKTNEIIKQVVDEKHTFVANLPGIEEFFIYRPQAGGDEYRILSIIKKERATADEESIGKRLHDMLCIDTEFNINGSKEIVSCSMGVNVHKCNGSEDPATLFHVLEKKSENNLDIEKIEKTREILRATIEKGRNLSISEYIDLIVEIWSPRRLGTEAMKILLNDVVGKVVVQSREFE